MQLKLNLSLRIGNKKVEILVFLIFKTFPLKIFHDHEELISLKQTDKIINNLNIKKVPVIDQINIKLIRYIKPGLVKFFHFFFNLCIYIDIHTLNWKIAKVIMLHRASRWYIEPVDYISWCSRKPQTTESDFLPG